MRYLPLTAADRAEMLGAIGADSVDALFADVPAFARLDGPVAGHGLGLTIARELLVANGGTIEIETTGPAGTTFLIALPAAGRAG